MSRGGNVYRRGEFVGHIEAVSGGYCFTYNSGYLASVGARPISLTLPLQTHPFTSKVLFPFFYGLLAEGILKETQCRKLKLDENDHFGRLLKTAHSDTIGDITVVEEQEA